ncbi:HpcH/HpaI aldolase/citrate lyase family protein [Arenibaculum pallidiluteum]|uniref:HpcH/HpaI aldolase/citrate lyase family protein n=1 Tax=Arenibaculum pallidiluteum TaxID=2812559 RepID=UPI001A96677B|nr:CoA ester lyase [Arenibaculum pallidiluteum]
MAATPRPRRSVLYMPGSNPRAIEKGRSLPADALILDLEDAVAPDAKEAARAQIAAALTAGGFGPRELVVRVNGLDTPWGRDDLAAMARAGADAVLLPKVDGPGPVREAVALLEANGAPAGLAVWCMVETPLGVLNAKEIAGSSPRMAALVMGTSDLAKDLRAAHTRDRLPMLTALGLCVLAARAYGLAALDGVHLDIQDDEGFAFACRQGRELGFDGKTLIHPRTIDAANAAFAPDEAEIAWARRVVAAHAEAMEAGRAVTLLDGKLVELLHVQEAQRLVSLAEAVRALTVQRGESR